ncbi:MAG: MFS transporter [Leptospirales bacterium]|nr:MFS transporter [Leptospirales bacterium]
MFAAISRPILILSLVSFFTDVASEMLYPVMPLYLGAVGYSVLFIGVLEGFAEAIAGISKGYFGAVSDAVGRRTPFVRLGYALSAISKPMLALSAAAGWIFLARSTDRIGKGLRTAARDALLSDYSSPETRATVFGFHRSLDTAGAVLGPLLALLLLQRLAGQYRLLFLIAFVPGLAAVALTLFIGERRAPSRKRPGLADFLRYLRQAPTAYRRLLTGLLLFAAFNSSDALLLLFMKTRGLSDTETLWAYIGYNVIFSLAAFPAGLAADRFGFRGVFCFGLVLFACCYGAMPLAFELWHFAALMLVYGIYAASTEGLAKAWISRLVPATESATAIGSANALQSLLAIAASATAAAIWRFFGAEWSLLWSAAGALAAMLYLLFLAPSLQTAEELRHSG